MKCPGCGAAVSESDSICPKCDYIIDASFLEAPPSPSGSHKPKPRPTGGKPAARAVTGEARAKRPGAAPAKKAAAPGGSHRAMPEAPGRRSDEDRAERERARANDDWRPKNQPTAPAGPAPIPAASKTGMEAQEEAFQEARLFVKYLPTSDKIALAAMAINVLISFFPWKETIVEGEVLGLMSLGAPVFVMSILGIASIFVRVRRVMPNLNPLAPWLAQLGVCCFCIVWCLVFMKLSYDGRLARALVGNMEMKISSPSFGVFVALVCSIGGLGGTLMGLRDKQS